MFKPKSNVVNKQILPMNLEILISNNRNIQQLIMLLLNQFGDLLKVENPRLYDELQNTTRYFDDMNAFLTFIRKNINQ